MHYSATKIALSLFTVAMLVGLFFVWQTRGETTIGLTLTTNPDLERGLILHWTFDGKDVDFSQTSAEVRDRSPEGNHGDIIGKDND